MLFALTSRPSTRAIFTSTSGSGLSKIISSTAFAMYWPIPGSFSRSRRLVGSLSLRCRIVSANSFIDEARRRHKPKGRNTSSTSERCASLNVRQSGNRSKKASRRTDTVSARVCCSSASVITIRYSDSFRTRQEKGRPSVAYHFKSRFRTARYGKLVIIFKRLICKL